jgi:hypothetical protein
VRAILLDNIDRIHTDGDLILTDIYVASIVKYRSIIASIQDIFTNMLDNDRKDTKFPHAQLQLLLEEMENSHVMKAKQASLSSAKLQLESECLMLVIPKHIWWCVYAHLANSHQLSASYQKTIQIRSVF